jgi:dipeptidyl-peptidase 4
MQKKTALILFFIILGVSALNGQKKELTLETLFSDRSIYGTTIQSVKWFDNDTKYSFLKLDPATRSMAIYQYDVKTGEESKFITQEDLVLEGEDEGMSIQNYEWSPDEKYILFTGTIPARRVKTAGTFFLYDISKKKFFVLAESEEEQINAAFSPDGSKLGFVRGNNMFVADISSGSIKQLTFDGSDVILNGLFDWVYEEEFSIIKAWKWSPDSRHIAFWRLDQSPVPKVRIAKWDSLYMNTLDMRYPKPGASNSIVNIGVVNIDDAKTIWMDIGEEQDIYIPRINFTKDQALLSIQRLNRLQNKLDFIMADIKTGKTNVIFTEKSDAWIDISDDLTFLEDGKRFIWTSEKDGFRHLYLYDYSGKQLNQLTKGNWQVENLYYADNEKVVFSANERGIRFSDLYQVNIKGTGFRRITNEPGVHSVIVSSKGKYYIDRYSNSTTVTSAALKSIDGKQIRDIVVPKTNPMEDYGFNKVEYFSFTASDGIELNAAMIKPWDFDENKKYPVLFDIYGGPGSSSMKDRWGGFSFAWQQLLAKEGYIIFTVDNRGTCGRGTAFKHVVYKRLGEMEVNDMVEGAKYLSTLGYVDTSRLGIWGWSYGGYMAALTITKAADYFKTAVAVAPVTHWKFYDTIYTERYMQTPRLNPKGYEESSVMHYAKNYKGNLLLIHGTADDNVHFQNSVVLADKLISENKQFSTMFYPEKDHSIYGGRTRQQLFRLITDYILEKL